MVLNHPNLGRLELFYGTYKQVGNNLKKQYDFYNFNQ